MDAISQDPTVSGGTVNEEQQKPEESTSQQPSNPGSDDPVKPFRDASMKFLQATMSVQQMTMKDSLQAYLDFQQTVRQLQQEAYDAVAEATRKHMARMSEQPPSGKVEEMYSSRLEAQANYENEVRQAYSNAQSKLQENAQKLFGPDGGDAMKKLMSARQEAYQQYLGDLQQAWSGINNLDPQTIKAIASNIICTLNAS